MSGAHKPVVPRAAGRVGIDLGGTKIEGVLLDREDQEALRRRVPTPRHDYDGVIFAIADLVDELRRSAGVQSSDTTIGIGMPGSISPATGLVQNSNSTWLNGKPFARDLAARLQTEVRFANDANCFTLSEAMDGAAAGAGSVLGVILGTGCGGGIVANGRLVDGPRGIGGEWGHTPLPWSYADEHPGPTCWCGRVGCMEVWVSGTGLAADYRRATGIAISAEDVVARAHAGDEGAVATIERHASRLARGLAGVVNIVDPEVIVLGGGLSKLAHLYQRLPALMAPHIFADQPLVDIRPPKWGDASGVRGAARLWD